VLANLKRLLEARYRLSTQLYLGIGGAVALTIAASVVGLASFTQVGEAQRRVNEGSVPELAAAFGVAEYSGTLVAAAPRLAAATSADEVNEVAESIESSRQELEVLFVVLNRSTGDPERTQRLRRYADTLLSNIDTIRRERFDLFELNERRQALRTELEDLRSSLEGVIVPALDDQLFYTMTGFRTLEEDPPVRQVYFSEPELNRYRRLAELQSDVNIATQLLASAFTVSSPSLLEPLRERFEASARRIERNLNGLSGSQFHDDLVPLFNRLFDVGTGDPSGFDVLEQELTLLERQQDLLASNRAEAVELLVEVDGLVSSARTSADEATQSSADTIATGRLLLLFIGAVSVGGALLIAWLFVGRFLLRRLQMLSDWMVRMAGGDLETRVEMTGRDEVADMAAALEVFRRHALEVQRLNLVEKLADELQDKNEQLESVLGDLQKAQDQIVMREKLAALGELTAGVAHEIRNPLNFVKNFAEASEELLEELSEVLEESGDSLPEADRELVEEVSQDLTDNLARIRSHGDRANRIVHDMLSMGRGSGERSPTDINQLVDEYARLAYHSARGMDQNFQLSLERDFDDEVGELNVVSQDLGRVFLNMVANSCYATDQRRSDSPAADGDDPFMPVVWLASRRLDEHIEVRIRDNGGGMPPDVVEKIFNPFYTTKPTGQGTGLGLAMCSDIVRQHGGNIRVEVEEGEGTEMIIDLPLVPPSDTAEQEADSLLTPSA
jgi:signal transduction histidine kinase